MSRFETILSGNGVGGKVKAVLPNSQYDIGCDDAISASTPVATIDRVVGVISKVKVFWPEAKRCVAMVKDKKSVANWTVGENPAQTVSSPFGVIELELTVPFGCRGAGPKEATGLCDWLAEVLKKFRSIALCKGDEVRRVIAQLVAAGVDDRVVRIYGSVVVAIDFSISRVKTFLEAKYTLTAGAESTEPRPAIVGSTNGRTTPYTFDDCLRKRHFGSPIGARASHAVRASRALRLPDSRLIGCVYAA